MLHLKWLGIVIYALHCSDAVNAGAYRPGFSASVWRLSDRQQFARRYYHHLGFSWHVVSAAVGILSRRHFRRMSLRCECDSLVIGFVCVGTGCRKAACCCRCLECGSDSLVSVTVRLGCVMEMCSQGGHPPGKFGDPANLKLSGKMCFCLVLPCAMWWTVCWLTLLEQLRYDGFNIIV